MPVGLSLARRSVEHRPRFNPLTSVCPNLIRYGGWGPDPMWDKPLDGIPVDAWRNQTGRAFDLVATAGDRPTMRRYNASIGNREGVEFVLANAHRLTFDITDLAQPFKILALLSVTAAGVDQGAFGFATGFQSYITKKSTNVWSMKGSAELTDGVAADTNPHVFRCTVNDPTSQIWMDKASIGGPGNGFFGSLAQIMLGKPVGNNTPMSGIYGYWSVWDNATPDAALDYIGDWLRGFHKLGQ